MPTHVTRDIGVTAFGAVAVWMFFSERYTLTLSVFLIYLGLFDGFLKLKTGSSVVTLGRDVLLYSITLGAVTRAILRRQAIAASPLMLGVVAWVLLCVAQIFNPSAASILHATSSIRQHIEFVPLFFAGYLILRSERRLVGLCVLIVVVTGINGVVALYQEHLTPAQLASWGPGFYNEVFGTSSLSGRLFWVNGVAYVRPPALGGDFGFGGALGVIAVPAALALAQAGRRLGRLSLVGWLGAPLIAVAVVTSESRTDVVSAAVALLAFLALTATSRRGFTVVIVTLIVGVLSYVIAVPLLEGSTPTRYSTIAPTEVVSTTLSYRDSTLALIPTYAVDYPLGAGMGSAGPAANSGLGGTTTKSLDAESEFTFLEIELGVPGLLLLTGLMLSFIALGIRLRRVADPFLGRLLCVFPAVLIAFFAVWIVGADTATSPDAPFMWLAGGTLAYWYGEWRAGRLPHRRIGAAALVNASERAS
jgi:hypothetical protein